MHLLDHFGEVITQGPHAASSFFSDSNTKAGNSNMVRYLYILQVSRQCSGEPASHNRVYSSSFTHLPVYPKKHLSTTQPQIAMSLLTTMKQWVVQTDKKDLDGMVFVDAPLPQVGENDILVKLHSAALNYRDAAIPKARVLHMV